MTAICLETPRLLLRPHTMSDLTDFYALNSVWEVVKYTGDAPMQRWEEAEKVLQEVVFPQYERYGHGRMAVILKKTGEYLGWCGLKYLEEENEIDVGYRFSEAHWGKGYATESAKICLNDGFVRLQLQRVIGEIDTENAASRQVLLKCGMTFVKKYQTPIIEPNDWLEQYWLERPNFIKNNLYL